MLHTQEIKKKSEKTKKYDKCQVKMGVFEKSKEKSKKLTEFVKTKDFVL